MSEKEEEIDVSILKDNHSFSISIRFSIMLILYVHRRISFLNLQKLLNLTSGNLNHHLNKLVDENFIEQKKILFSKRPLTFIFITEKGKQEFGQYLDKFKDVIKKIEEEN